VQCAKVHSDNGQGGQPTGEHEQLDGAERHGIRAAVANGARDLAAKHQENGMKRGPVADRWARATQGGFSLSGSYRVRGSGLLKKDLYFSKTNFYSTQKSVENRENA
jgi:hypothetical protein